jgi:DNA helicase IV
LADDPASALTRCLEDLSAAVAGGEIPAGRDGTVSVDVLGRHRFERDVLPSYPPANLHVTFRTVHGSKGLEADYIVIPGMTTGTYGFPSTMSGDPVLHLAMPAPETFPPRRGTPSVLCGLDPGTPGGRAYHPSTTDVSVRHRAT